MNYPHFHHGIKRTSLFLCFTAIQIQAQSPLPTSTTTSITTSTQTSPTSSPTHEKFLEFEYDPYSPWGPPFWAELDVKHNEYVKWTHELIYTQDEMEHKPRIDENECGNKIRQSPVNLLPNEICTDTHEILSRKIRRSDCKFDDFSWSITPHFLRATMPVDNTFCIRPHIDLPNGFPNKWFLQFMELHVRSEHTLDGRRYDAELQMVHLGTEPHEEKLATVSMMMEASSIEDDEMIQWMIDEWQAVADKRDTLCEKKLMTNVDGAPALNDGVSQKDGRELRGSNQDHSKSSTNDDEHPSNEFFPPRVYRNLNPSTHPAHADEQNLVDEEEKIHDWEALDWDDPALVYGDSYYKDNITGEIYPIIEENEYEDYFDEFHQERELQTNRTKPIRQAPRRKMFPYIMWPTIYFYRYRGSITSPPCSRIVHWRVLDEPRKISVKQLRQMAKLLQGYRNAETCELQTQTHPVSGENWRPVLPITDKSTTHCQSKDFSFWRYWPDQQ